LDIFCSETKAWKNLTIFPDPDVLAQAIVEDLEVAVEQFREIAADLGVKETKP
jgi:type I restriction enzyme M protein